MQLVFEDNFDGELDKSIWKTSFEQPIRRGGGIGRMNKLLPRTATLSYVRNIWRTANTAAVGIQALAYLKT